MTRDEMQQWAVEAVKWCERIRSQRPSIEVPADPDVYKWTVADVRLYSAAIEQWGEWYVQVHDRVSMFLACGAEWAERNGAYLAPGGLSEAIAADDVAAMDRLMSAIETHVPELLTLPAGILRDA